VRTALALAYDKKAFLFQVRPDLFPEGYLTPVEAGLWELFYKDL